MLVNAMTFYSRAWAAAAPPPQFSVHNTVASGKLYFYLSVKAILSNKVSGGIAPLYLLD